MGLENVRTIDPERSAAIAEHFRDADQKYNDGDVDAFTQPVRAYQGTFGDINIADLELVFRQHKFHTHFFAVPSVLAHRASPTARVIDLNDGLAGKPNPRGRKVGFLVLPSLETLLEVATNFAQVGWVYTPETNLQLLDNAGAMVDGPFGRAINRRSAGTRGRRGKRTS